MPEGLPCGRNAGVPVPLKGEMRMKKASPLKFPALLLGALYIGMAALRFLLATATHGYPSVMIDEMLYYNIARSIANGEGLLYLGQPADYTSILYPLVLSPIYALFPAGTDYFRLIQLWNILLMNLSLFPVYALARAAGGSQRTALWVGAAALLLPDMMLGGLIMSESILYPLFFTLMYFGYRYLRDGRLPHILLIGVLGGLIYFTKPGQVVPAAVILLWALIDGIKNRSGRQIGKALAGVACLALVIAASFVLVRVGFRRPASLLGMYGNQVSAAADQRMDLFFQGLFLSPCFFYLICGGACCAAPFLRIREFSPQNRRFFAVVLLSVLVTILGTAWVINRVEYSNFAVHTRYIAPYVPLFLLFSLLPSSAGERAKKALSLKDSLRENRIVWILTAYVILCLAVFGYQSGLGKKGVGIFNLGVSFLRNDAVLPEWLGIALLMAGACLLAWYLPRMKKKNADRLCVGVLILLSLLNGAAAYQPISPADQAIIAENKKVSGQVGSQEYLYICGESGKFYDIYLDVNHPRTTQTVSVNDLFVKAVDSQGVYMPFVPPAQRGMIPEYETPDTDMILMDKAAALQIMLADGAEILNPEGEYLFAVRIPRDKPWMDSLLGGPLNGIAAKGESCYIKLFNQQYTAGPIAITVDIELNTPSEFQVYTNKTNYTSFHFPAGRNSYTLSIASPSDVIRFVAPDSEMRIYDYQIAAEKR